MKKRKLSIFVDESGDFGKYQNYCPFYLVTFVFHDQSKAIKQNILKVDEIIKYLKIPNNYVHAGPIIRDEGEFSSIDLATRKKALTINSNFIRRSPIFHHTFIIEKSKVKDGNEISDFLSNEIRSFFLKNEKLFKNFDIFEIFYDNGQKQLSNILGKIIPICFSSKIIFKIMRPAYKYKLFQIADNICTFELIKIKIDKSITSNSEKLFFMSKRNFLKNYYKKILKNRV